VSPYFEKRNLKNWAIFHYSRDQNRAQTLESMLYESGKALDIEVEYAIEMILLKWKDTDLNRELIEDSIREMRLDLVVLIIGQEEDYSNYKPVIDKAGIASQFILNHRLDRAKKDQRFRNSLGTDLLK